MEKFVLSLYGLWFWLTRNYRSATYREAADALAEARAYLFNDYATRASTIDRGTLLPMHLEALDLLEHHSSFAARTSKRFASIRECCRFLTEELAQVPTASSPVETPVAIAAGVSSPFSNLMASFVTFLRSEQTIPARALIARSLSRWILQAASTLTSRSAPAHQPGSSTLQPHKIDFAA